METRKRKALADITNAENLIPTSVLRKLVASSNNSSSISKPPISILRSISSSTNKKFCSDSDNRSDVCSNSSISSSNISSTRNSRTVQFQTPPISPGDVVSKDAAHYKMLNVEKSDKKKDADVVITSPTPVEKRKDKGKSIAVTLCSPCPIKIKDNENAMLNLSSSLEKTKQKGKANLIILDEPAQNVKKYVKGILNPSRCSYEKPDKGKAIIIPAGHSVCKTKDMEKGFEKTYSRSVAKTIPKKKETLRPSGICIRESREVGSEILNASHSVVERTEETGKALSIFGSSHKETNDKGKAILHSSERVETYTCPPRLRTKHIHYDPDEGGNSEPLKSWTGPRPVTRKKRDSKMADLSELPHEYIEQQKAYFKEIDSFELPEEEVSEDELD